MGDFPFAVTFSEEEQITNLKWLFYRLRSGVLHICVARKIKANPAME
jgi:hypothetical protein